MTLLNSIPSLLIGMPSGGELITILIIVIVLFGGKKIPELARGVGKGIREFNDAKEGVKTEIENSMKPNANNTATTTTIHSTDAINTNQPFIPNPHYTPNPTVNPNTTNPAV